MPSVITPSYKKVKHKWVRRKRNSNKNTMSDFHQHGNSIQTSFFFTTACSWDSLSQ